MGLKKEWVWALVVALAVGTFGVLLGVVWYLIAPPLPLRKVNEGLAYLGPDPEQPVAADGWFVILGFAFGVLAAIMVWVVGRRQRGPVQMVGLTLGAIAAGVLAWQVGKSFNVEEYQAKIKSAQVGEIVEKPIDLAATSTKTCVPGSDLCFTMRGGDLLVPALGGVVGYALLAGWSRWPSLRRNENEEEEALNSEMEWAARAEQESPERLESPAPEPSHEPTVSTPIEVEPPDRAR